MNILRTGARQGSGGGINEPGNARFQQESLLAKDLRRTQGNHFHELIIDWQSLNQSWTLFARDAF